MDERQGSGLGEILRQAAGAVLAMGPAFETAGRGLEELGRRLEAERFHLAVLGQFKRGKSTFLNALLGLELLPTSVVPLTAIPTFIRWGPELAVHISFLDDRADEVHGAGGPGDVIAVLERYVTEEANPENARGVRQAEVASPAAILAGGLVLIDTPGIGSTYQHNTETTLNFLSQCDAALFLVSADPPVTEVELSFLREVVRKVPRLFFLFNKIDYLREPEREKALTFFREVLAGEAGIGDGAEIFPVSARDGLEARSAGDDRRLAASGVPEVEDHLVRFLMHEKARLLNTALARKAAELVNGALLQLELKSRSLLLPLEELEERTRILERKIEEARSERTLAGDRLEGDRKRAMALLEDQSSQLREKAREYLEQKVVQAVAGVRGWGAVERRAHETLAEAIPGFFEHELGTFSREFDDHVREVIARHQSRADELVEAVRHAAAELFDIPYHAAGGTTYYEEARQPYWVTRRWNTSFNPIPVGALDWLLPGNLKRAAALRRLMAQVRELTLHNVENLRWATLQNLDRAFRRFTNAMDARLVETVEATAGAVQAAVRQRRERAGQVEDERRTLEASVDRLSELSGRLAELSEPGALSPVP